MTSGLTSNELRRIVSPEINPRGVGPKSTFFSDFRFEHPDFGFEISDLVRPTAALMASHPSPIL